MKRWLNEDDFSEEFTSIENRNNHYYKHIRKRKEYDMSPEEYEKAAEKLANTPCDYKNIFGYVSKDKENSDRLAYVKYDKNSELFTVYIYKNNKPFTITAFRRSWRDFNGKMYDPSERFEYDDEIPRGK